MPTDPALAELSVLGALAMNWMDTTHGNDLGHDHHCLVRTPGHEKPSERDIEECTCGWATFYAKYLSIAEGAHAEPQV